VVGLLLTVRHATAPQQHSRASSEAYMPQPEGAAATRWWCFQCAAGASSRSTYWVGHLDGQPGVLQDGTKLTRLVLTCNVLDVPAGVGFDSLSRLVLLEDLFVIPADSSHVVLSQGTLPSLTRPTISAWPWQLKTLPSWACSQVCKSCRCPPRHQQHRHRHQQFAGVGVPCIHHTS
jgi:hypothetical protein